MLGATRHVDKSSSMMLCGLKTVSLRPRDLVFYVHLFLHNRPQSPAPVFVPASDSASHIFPETGGRVAALFVVASGAQVRCVGSYLRDGGGDKGEEAFVAGAGYDV